MTSSAAWRTAFPWTSCPALPPPRPRGKSSWRAALPSLPGRRQAAAPRSQQCARLRRAVSQPARRMRLPQFSRLCSSTPGRWVPTTEWRRRLTTRLLVASPRPPRAPQRFRRLPKRRAPGPAPCPAQRRPRRRLRRRQRLGPRQRSRKYRAAPRRRTRTTWRMRMRMRRRMRSQRPRLMPWSDQRRRTLTPTLWRRPATWRGRLPATIWKRTTLPSTMRWTAHWETRRWATVGRMPTPLRRWEGR
mmetsp:Transcript_18850/g.71839  ORF Transcript_18850/g.71839 Transcript_18850/m.71839 type:complete len:245 (+) Transcript_18850:1259-1993(+)